MAALGEVVIALNPGSSSLKVAVRNPRLVLSAQVERLATSNGNLTVTGADGRQTHHSLRGGIDVAVDRVAAELGRRGLRPDAVAHRVVQGGEKHWHPTIIDDELVAELRELTPFAPLHQPGNLDSIGHARRAWPDAVHVACFDTGFHHDLPEEARRLPVSDSLDRLGVRRYGFHGLSVQSALRAHPDLGGAVIAHLGSGCSVSAVDHGRPRHTTMSMTPTSGMISATRSGDLDPEVVLYLIQQHGYGVDQLRDLLDHRCGVAGVADGRSDMRDLLGSDDAAASLAVGMFVRSAAMAVASCVTTLPRWDSLVFTGGIGQHAEPIRRRICAALLPLRAGGSDPSTGAPADLAATGIRVLVVPADEEGVMDELTRALLRFAPTGATLPVAGVDLG